MESIESRLTRLTVDVDVERIDMLLKCKTQDGMIFTLEVTEFYKKDCPKDLPFADYISSGTLKGLLSATELVATDGFWFSGHEMACIKRGEITRLWIEIGDVYVEGAVME